MAEETSLTVVEQKQVAFYGDEILAVRLQDNSILIPVRPICELLGVDWSAQRRRINRDPVLERRDAECGYYSHRFPSDHKP